MSFNTPFTHFRQKISLGTTDKALLDLLDKQQGCATDALQKLIANDSLAESYVHYKSALAKLSRPKLELGLSVASDGRVVANSDSNVLDALSVYESEAVLSMTAILSLGFSGGFKEREMLASVLAEAMGSTRQEA